MNKNPKVEDFLKAQNHPMDLEIRRVRDFILNVSDQITEDIKWNSPTFIYKGNMASYFMNAKKHVSLMFHKGAFLSLEGNLLEGQGKEGRTAKFYSLEDINKKKQQLTEVVRAWMQYRDEA